MMDSVKYLLQMVFVMHCRLNLSLNAFFDIRMLLKLDLKADSLTDITDGTCFLDTEPDVLYFAVNTDGISRFSQSFTFCRLHL